MQKKKKLAKSNQPVARSLNNKVYAKKGEGSVVLETLEGAESYNEWIAEKIAPYLGLNNLEIGAGQGAISEQIAKTNPIILSDIATYNVNALKHRFRKNKNIKSIVQDPLKISAIKNLDCIYSSNVLEHIEDDAAVVTALCNKLKVGGYFVAVVPAMQALYSDFDQLIGHYRRYDQSDGKRILKELEKKKIKMRLVKNNYFDPVGMIGWFLKMKLLKQQGIKQSDLKLYNVLFPFIKFASLFPLPFGKNILLILQKER